jgi:sugar (pentulose or hexulose) kinase
MLQAAFEGAAYLFAAIADRLPEVREVVATGGALQADPGWTQILADVLERPVVASAVPEGSARGAACLALERMGEEPPPAPLGRSFFPREDRFSAYRLARERQRRLYEELT